MTKSARRMSTAEVRRCIRAATEAGLIITRTEFREDGVLILHHTKETPSADQALDAWKDKKNARPA